MERASRRRPATASDLSVGGETVTERSDNLPAGEGSRSARKRRAILDAARTVFLRKGYLGTSMDEIASLAAVSKQTVYKHFADKDRLFAEIILSTMDNAYQAFMPALLNLRETDDPEKGLTEFARMLVTVLMQPQVVQMRRLVIAEANRFPELGANYYERTFERSVEALAISLRKLANRSGLRIEDPLLAAHQLTWLIISIARNKVMLCGDGTRFTTTELEGHADGAVRTFLAAYGAAGPEGHHVDGPVQQRPAES